MQTFLRKVIALVALWVYVAPNSSDAGIISFHGRAPISYGSSIPGIVRHDLLYFDLAIDDSVIDTTHIVFSNASGGVTALGHFSDVITHFRLYASPSNLGYYDPINVTYDYSRSYFTTIDAGPGPTDPIFSEKIKFVITVSDDSLTAGAPYQFVVLNLYNGTLFDPPATRQLWVDESASGQPTSFADFFLHGSKTLEEFRGAVPANADTARDGIFLEGLSGSGQLSSGAGVTMTAVPEPSSVAIYGFSLLAAGFAARRKRRLTTAISGK
jgi:hypothetical protein